MSPPCLFVFRCGTTPWLRQPRTGLTPACGSTGHLTSSGSWVKTSPSGQDGEWSVTPLPPPKHLLLSQQSWSLPCSPLLLSPKGFCTVTRWLPEECSCDPSNKQKLCFFSHDPWGQRRIPLVGLDFPFGNTGHLHVFLHFSILLRNNMRLKGIQL